MGDLRSEIFLFHAARMRRMNHSPQRLVSPGPLRLFRWLVKSRIDARIGHNSNGLFSLYNDRGFIEIGFVRIIFAKDRANRKVMRSIDRHGPPSCVTRSRLSVLRRQSCVLAGPCAALRPLFAWYFRHVSIARKNALAHFSLDAQMRSPSRP